LVTWTIPAVTWTIPAVITWCFRPYALLQAGCRHSRGCQIGYAGPYWLPSTGALTHNNMVHVTKGGTQPCHCVCESEVLLSVNTSSYWGSRA
jgi:hypothetical protein